MGERETLLRVQEDLASGRVALARQRLRGLVGSYPHRLDLREQLAELYRRDGIHSQAGRWSYLSESPDADEVRAFEREYLDPVHRMRALGWRGPEDVAGERVRDRLAALRARAEQQTGRPLSWEHPDVEPPSASGWGERLFMLAALIVLALVVLGGLAFLIHGVRTVVTWLAGQA